MPPPGYRKSVRRFKVEQILSPEDLKEYQALLKDPRTTVKKAHAWLTARGYRVGYAAVGRHRRRFDEDVVAVRKTAMLAEHFAEASRGGGMAALSDATVARFQQVLLDRLMKLDQADDPQSPRSADFSPKEWLELARTIAASVATRRSLETLRAEYDDRVRKAAEAVEKAGRTRDWKQDGPKVADAVRRILGVPLPDEPVPEDDPSLALIEFPQPRPPRRLPPPSDN